MIDYCSGGIDVDVLVKCGCVVLVGVDVYVCILGGRVVVWSVKVVV